MDINSKWSSLGWIGDVNRRWRGKCKGVFPINGVCTKVTVYVKQFRKKDAWF